MPTSNRSVKERAILEATLAQLRETGTANITMQQIANRCSMARSAIYQYFSSVEDIFAELVINDMADLVNEIDIRMAKVSDPVGQVNAWLHYSLKHLSDGEHAQIRRLSELKMPQEKRDLLRILHGQFMMSLLSPVTQINPDHSESTCAYIASVVNSAANRIDAGADFAKESEAVSQFVTAAISK
jgi:AcrR family transcriptional regulator